MHNFDTPLVGTDDGCEGEPAKNRNSSMALGPAQGVALVAAHCP